MFDFITAPFSLLLRFLSEQFNSYGLALILFALLMALIRVPFDIKGKRGSMGQALVAPKVKEIQEKHAGNQAKIHQETQKLWKEEGIKPMSGCVWMLFPAAIMLLLFTIIRQPLTHLMGLDETQLETLRATMEGLGVSLSADGIAGFAQVEMAGYISRHFEALHAAVPQIYNLNMNFVGLDLGQIPDWRVIITPEYWASWADLGLFLLPLASVGMMYFSQKVITATNYMQQMGPPQQQQMMKMMMLTMPLISLFIGFTFPAAMSVYFVSSSFFFSIASIFMNRRFKRIFTQMKAEMEERDRLREAELEEKRQETARLRALNATRENKGTSKKKKQAQDREKERRRQAANRAASNGEAGVDADAKEDASRVAHRKFARGRAYDPDRFSGLDEESPDSGDEDEYPDLLDPVEEERIDDTEPEGIDDIDEPEPASDLETGDFLELPDVGDIPKIDWDEAEDDLEDGGWDSLDEPEQEEDTFR